MNKEVREKAKIGKQATSAREGQPAKWEICALLNGSTWRRSRSASKGVEVGMTSYKRTKRKDWQAWGLAVSSHPPTAAAVCPYIPAECT